MDSNDTGILQTEKVNIMGNYSKFFGAIVGGILAWLTAKFGLPAEWAAGDFAAAITTVVTAVVVWAFPANDPGE